MILRSILGPGCICQLFFAGLMAPNSGRQQRGPRSMDPDWQTHEPGGSGEQVPRAAPSSLPCIQRPVFWPLYDIFHILYSILVPLNKKYIRIFFEYREFWGRIFEYFSNIEGV